MKVHPSKVTNMTEGSTVRLILAFAIPMFIGNVFQQAYNMVDTMIAGRFLGEEAIAAIGATATLYSLLMNITWGLNNGYCVVLSREFGAGDRRPERDTVSEMFTTGFSMAMMQAVFALGSVILQRAINALGSAVITAHTASRRVYEMLMVPMTTLAHADSTFVGQNYGAGKYDRIVQANRKALLMELGWSLVSIAVCWLLGRRLMMWLTGTSNEEIIANALLNLRLSTACFFPLGALFVLRYSMQAMGHKVLPVLSSTIELAGKIISAAALVPALGYLGVAVTEPVIWCLCAAFLAVCYGTIGCQKGDKHET